MKQSYFSKIRITMNVPSLFSLPNTAQTTPVIICFMSTSSPTNLIRNISSSRNG